SSIRKSSTRSCASSSSSRRASHRRATTCARYSASMHIRASDISTWLRERVTAAGARGLVVGLSGGIDSAVVAALCQMAAPDNTIGVILPCNGDPQDDADAQLVADHLKLATLRI